MSGHIPEEFIEAARKDVLDTGYYRRAQKVAITACEDGVELCFSSTLVPVRENGVVVKYPDVYPPAGLVTIDEHYMVGQNKLLPKEQFPLKKIIRDSFFIKYKFETDLPSRIRDEHFWLSPVNGYKITATNTATFQCNVTELAWAKRGAMQSRSSKSSSTVIFSNPNAVFSGQGFEWRVERRA